MPGLEPTLAYLKTKKVKLGLASSSPMSLIKAVVNKFNLTQTFQTLQSAEHLDQGKPHPEVYLNAAQALAVNPKLCLAIEDSIQGILAAKAAKMLCLAKPDVSLSKDPRLSIADLRIGAFSEFNELLWQDLEGLLNS
jgi:sugar-phosphatase